MRRGFAILDFETTGLSPNRGDRVIEVGAVYMGPDGKIDGGIETLVNPQRDVGPTRIHGISARDVHDAPTFDRVAPSLLEMLDGRVIVGHNVSFDLRFLTAELERDKYSVPDYVVLDTLHLAKTLFKYDPPPSYKLHDISAHLGFSVRDVMNHAGLEERPEHSALGDAMVTAYLLSRLIEMSTSSSFWDHHLELAEGLVWPEYYPVETEAKRRGEKSKIPSPNAPLPEATVSDVLKALGASETAAPATVRYADLLEASLADRVLDVSEVDALVAAARQLGLNTLTLRSLHRGQFDDVVREAWADGVLTEEERRDIHRVAQLLGIDDDSLSSALGRSESVTAVALVAEDAELSILRLSPAAVIVLTGEMLVERGHLEAEILARGFVVGNGVTKKTALVIAADPFTQSSKAKKARAYGIPLLGEQEGMTLVRTELT